MIDMFWFHQVIWSQWQLCFRKFSIFQLNRFVDVFANVYFLLQKKQSKIEFDQQEKPSSSTRSCSCWWWIQTIISCTKLHLCCQITRRRCRTFFTSTRSFLTFFSTYEKSNENLLSIGTIKFILRCCSHLIKQFFGFFGSFL